MNIVMENIEETVADKNSDVDKNTEVEVEQTDKEDKKESKVKESANEIIIGGKVPDVGGVAGLLGQTASILSSLVQKEEEKPKFALNPEDVETYKAAFNDFDHNKDGHISTQVR